MSAARAGRREAPQGKRVVAITKRGRFLAAEPLFEPGPRLALARGSARVKQGQMALAELRPGSARVLKRLGSPERARDFDDAVSAERTGDGLRLWIHIADVAAHVKPGTALEKEAYGRANSTYVPGTVEPMLPEALSNEACSLSPNVPRLAVTAEIVLGGDGKARSASFYRSRIRSDARLNYDQLDDIFAERMSPPEPVVEPMKLARQAAATLAEHRPPSAIEVAGSEPEFRFDDGDVISGHSVPQTEAHRLIEQLMLLTNGQVAELLEQRKVPTLYRVHENPDPQRVEVLAEQLDSLGVPTPPIPDNLGPTDAARLAGDASRLVAAEAARRGHGREAYTTLVLRSLKQAYYSDRNVGHAGLASSAYCHFTSPIRRYPDLVVHRGLLSVIAGDEPAPDPSAVRDAAAHCSERERDAVRVERDADDVCAAFLLRRELFASGWEREFEGEVRGLVGAGAFVGFGGDLADVYEGFLPARLLRGERFDLNEVETALVGRRSGRALRLGDPVTVRVDSIEAPRGRVDLIPAEEG